MSQIKIDISKVRSDTSSLRLNINKVSNIKAGINSLRHSIDGKITARRNISSRLNSAYANLNALEKKLRDLDNFKDEAMDRYEKTENKVQKMGEAMAGLSAKGLGINLDLYTTGAINDPTTSEYAKMFLDGGSGEIESEKDEDDETNLDKVLTSAVTSGGVGAADKSIGLASANGLLGERTNTIETGLNRETRRKWKLPKEFEQVKSIAKLREGFGVANVVLSTGTVYEDWKNNDTLGSKAGSIGTDAVTTGAAFAISESVAGLGASALVGGGEIVAGIIGIAALPEIAVGVLAVTGAVIAVGALGWIASTVASKVKTKEGWN